MTHEIKEVNVFCDYSADGLWIDGAYSNLEDLLDELNITIPDFKELNEKINKWQEQYEQFEFYLPEYNIKDTKEYKEFDKTGREIALRIRQIVPDNIKVTYWDEANLKKYSITPDGKFQDITSEELKEIHDTFF